MTSSSEDKSLGSGRYVFANTSSITGTAGNTEIDSFSIVSRTLLRLNVSKTKIVAPIFTELIKFPKAYVCDIGTANRILSSSVQPTV